MKRCWERNVKYLSMLGKRAVFAIVSLGIAADAAVGAEAYPQRHIALIVASATGGPADSAARIIGGPMSAFLGQQIIIENAPGGGGMIGAPRVARPNAAG